MRYGRLILFLLCPIAFLAARHPAVADTVQDITVAGQISSLGGGVVGMNLSGPGLTLQTSAFEIFTSGPFVQPGTLVDLSATITGPTTTDTGGLISGVRYEASGVKLNLLAVPALAQSSPDGSQMRVLATPVSMEGTIQGCLRECGGGNPSFSLPLTGQGTAGGSLVLITDPSNPHHGQFELLGASYSLQPAVVPEPSSWLLLAPGLIALHLFRKPYRKTARWANRTSREHEHEMVGNTFHHFVMVILISFLVAQSALAESLITDTIALTSGTVTGTFFGTGPSAGDAQFHLFGDPQFLVNFGGQFALTHSSNVFSLGSPIDLSGRFGSATANVFMYRGQLYGDIGPVGTGIGGQLITSATTGIDPGGGCGFPLPHTNCYNAQVPFVMFGQATGFALHPPSPVSGPPPELALTLMGRGIATGLFFLNDAGQLVLGQVRYDFTPIPESSTWLLLGAGLLVLVFARYRPFFPLRHIVHRFILLISGLAALSILGFRRRRHGALKGSATALLMALIVLPILPAEAVDITVNGSVNPLGCNGVVCPTSRFTLAGQDFSLVSTPVTLNPADPFTHGQEVDLGGTLFVPGGATLTFEGVKYLPGGFDAEIGRNFGSLSFVTPLVPIPQNPGRTFELSSTAFLSATLLGLNPTTNQEVTFNLSGFGTATANFFGPVPNPINPSAGSVFQLSRVDYTIVGTPEPPTWVLVASGLVALTLIQRVGEKIILFLMPKKTVANQPPDCA